MKPREKFILALKGGQPSGRVPHFELVFFLTMEAFGRVHPSHRFYKQWNQMSLNERKLHIRDIASLYVVTAQKYEHSAIFFHSPKGWTDNNSDQGIMHALEEIRRVSGMEYFLMIEGDITCGLPNGDKIMNFVSELADNPQQFKDKAQAAVDKALKRAEFFRKNAVLDGFALCSDYCFNSGPFLSPAMFDEFVTPYLTNLIAGYRQMGFYTIKHTDGNIMPILDSLVSAGPHALHSLDPQGGIDIAEIKRLVGDKLCLIGNVNCGLMDTGTDEEVIESAAYALKHGMPGGGYIFSTSNCIYTGMPLKRYELILDIWKKQGNYRQIPAVLQS
ncbi:MAG: uroporphyrinogen decarboxylase family protein [Phycisphaerae bacterium]|nr:uroporphyrinogen decarboxylase family protein [Phycisphaerae bacterium]